MANAAHGINETTIEATEGISTYVNERLCPTCGKPLPPAKAKGRPMERHPECRKLEQLLSWTEDLLQEIQLEKEKASAIRGRLWYLGNTVKTAGQKGVK